MLSHFLGSRSPDPVPGFDFENCKYGWIDFRLTHTHGGLQEKHDIRCSHVFDPLPDFIAWLEALTRGATEASWTVNEEGCLARLRTVRSGDCVELFCESKNDDANATVWAPRLRVTVRTVELVSSAYWALRRFADSPAFAPVHWALTSRFDRWMHCYSQDWGLSLDRLATDLSAWSRDEVLAALFHSHPAFDTDFRPSLPLLDPAWDSSSPEVRAATLRALLAEPTDGYTGTDPRTLHSPVIEAWCATHERRR